MNRLTRITSILIQLQSKKIVTAKEIAQRFEVSLRTVYRDIKTLQEAGVPIGSENGTGYFIVDGFHLPPISLSEEEANSLIVSEMFIKNQGDTSLIKNYNSLLIKLKSTLRNFQKDNIEYVSNRTINFQKNEVQKSNWLSDIQWAIASKQQLQITYQSIYKNEVTKRNIEPLAVYFTNAIWVVIGFCNLRSSIREFRLDKISTLIKTTNPFSYKASFNLQNYFESL